jgi:hypothetical protein
MKSININDTNHKLFRRFISGIILFIPVVFMGSQSALADRRDFRIVNDNDLAIERVYISSTQSRNWGSDVLGRDVLPSGQSLDVEFNNNSRQCVYDIRVVYEDNSYDLLRENLCETSEVKMYGDGGEYQ